MLVGGALAHYRADPGSFYGFDLTKIFPSQILRTWHLQLAIFWIATAFVAGGLFLSSALGGKEPHGQVKWINLLFFALLLVVGGSLLGELLGVRQLLGNLWFWFGHQGWEYLDLGRAWQVLLAAGLVMWLILLFRAVRPALKDKVDGEISSLFLYAAATIPLFYLPAFFFGSTSSYTVVDTWRFWIIHLWVEGFFELFVTVMVAVLFYKLGIVTPADSNQGDLSGCNSVSRQRYSWHRPSLVLDRPDQYHHGTFCGIFCAGSCPSDSYYPGCLGLHKSQQNNL